MSDTSGHLKPARYKKISVTIQSHAPIFVDTMLYIQTGQNDIRYLSCKAHIDEVCVRISEQLVDFGEIFEETSVVKKVTLRNFSHFPTSFCWYVNNSAYEDQHMVSIYPKYGTIDADNSVEVEVRVDAQKVGDYELLIPCVFHERDELAQAMLVRSQVRGLKVRIDLTDEERQEYIEREETAFFCQSLVRNCIKRALRQEIVDSVYIPTIDFGHVLIFSRKTIILTITNLSDCIGFFAVRFEKHPAPIDHSRRRKSTTVSFHPRNKESPGCSRSSGISHRSVLKNSNTSGTSRSQSSEERAFALETSEEKWKEIKRIEEERNFDKEMLAHGSGVVFDVNKLNGRIPGSRQSTVKLKLTCFSNKLGEYDDECILEIVDASPVRLPIKCTIVGVPIRLRVQKTLGLYVTGPGSYHLKYPISPCGAEVTKTVIVSNDSLQGMCTLTDILLHLLMNTNLTSLHSTDRFRYKMGVTFNNRY